MDSIPLSIGMAFAAGIVGAITLLSAVLLEDDFPSKGGGKGDKDAETAVVTNEAATVPDGDPQVDAPVGGPPPADAPQVDAPQVDAPQVDAPQVGAPQVGGPQVGGPQVGGPQVGGPQVGGPQVGGPQVGGPVIGYLTNAKAAVFVGRGKPFSNLLSKHYDERKGIASKINGLFSKKPAAIPQSAGGSNVGGESVAVAAVPVVEHVDAEHAAEHDADQADASVEAAVEDETVEAAVEDETVEAAVEEDAENQKATYILPTVGPTNGSGGAASSSHGQRSAAYIRNKIARKMRKRYTPTS